MGKKKAVKRKAKPKFQDTAPNQQFIGQFDPSAPPPLPPNQEQIAFRKRLQGAILTVSEQFMREHQNEIVVRAMDLLKSQDL